MAAVQTGDLDSKDLPYIVAESLMHETIHALEEWAGVEFSEERVEELLIKYRDKYAQAAPKSERMKALDELVRAEVEEGLYDRVPKQTVGKKEGE